MSRGIDQSKAPTLEQFIIFLLGYVSIILSGLFAMKSLPSIPTATVIGIIGAIAAAVAAYAAVVLLWKQEARWEYEDRPRVEASEFRIEADNIIWLFTNVGKEDATQDHFIG